ncbi:hypothetical protein QAD02_016647 [Eretmocerus hayati]|uniref:Uncharacterized protein n=1 Tax=Eretmocerus hayati TaxID=131215 RepID=A0ACC2PB82_9HYME|nr:hypothetical protein QAD02_016647 [Eretmocerus hayati]
MDFRGSESALYEVVSPAFYVTRVFGLAPYAFPRNNRPAKLQPSRKYCIFAIVWIIIYGYIVVHAFIRFDAGDDDRPVLGATEKAKLILNYMVSVTELSLSVLNRKNFVHVWNSIQEFDESFRLGVVLNAVEASKGQPLKYGPLVSQSRIWLWSSLVVSTIGWTAINQLGMHAFNEPYLRNVGYLLTYVGTYIAVFKFCGIVFLLGQRFAYLNRLILRRTNNGVASSLDEANVQRIEFWYNQLLDTSRKFNDTYSCSLLMFIFNLFLHTVCNMYFFVYWLIVNPDYLTNAKVMSCEFVWLVMFVVQLMALYSVCDFASEEANRTAAILLNWRRMADRPGKQNDFKSTIHLLNQRLYFTAGGCFHVDLPSLTSTFGHLTTYLVILLQLPKTKEDS